ncbi:snRNA-activating protein complex subunit 4 [Pygocentrus nattereri]|uniref:snRNA-activating protein complex subunit 4 n=1 Tax=Pygocentrus nattereri TaxID=42514 RepID=UPI001891641D|nr:snRNA-activating protein complex subunit 4 [Pygocentrus nattereri]XP_017546594.2 snRNA-activating protein complex subunit 4 [Pygocentrus nattereri]XP_017546595.2 snRNA-activating protein complex subunit 4 [Pygocentrus nattereri]XP_017546596.2 snRNA-activating protein complex subunit 4 [Pygocentrus nattereri]XP_017546597.2 snRNA-activating protein complex subunit 4 [Pygocentrus nattereri]XP_037387667.1 snRNA-activating protein complex subunit 4 [Pygocentrus nattereri]
MASPEDLLSQRNKIQRQILELETALGADSSVIDLLSSSSDSDEESDDSGHAGEEAASEDLEAKRQQIQKEIEALEQTLGVDAALVAGLTDNEHGTGSHMDSSDEDSDEELDLPQDVETCLQMNLVYQEVLKEKLADLERLLSENRQQQKEIEAQLSGPVSAFPGLPHMKLYLGTFMKPYFKDKLTGLGPPANEETKERLSYGTRPCDEMKIRRWEAWQKTLLINSVVSDTMKRMLQPKMSKLDYLTAKMSKAEDVDKETLKKQIVFLEKEIEEISSMSEEQLYGNRHDDHDWDKIANIDFEGLRQPEDLERFWQNYLHPSINKSTWKQDEIEKLSAVAEQFKFCHWDQIAEALGTNRTAFMCFQTYQRYIAKNFRKREWTKEEDQVLCDLVQKMRIGNFLPYTQISYFMEGRDHAQLMYRWTCVLDPSIKKGPWSKEEDQLLLKAVEKYGPKDWWKIRLEVPGRTDNACRDRYLDCLRDDVKRGAWSDDEVELLKKLVEKYGVGKWAKIATEIPNRIDSQCLNKWKWIVRTTAKQGIKREIKGSTKSKSKKRKVTKKMIKEESEMDSNSEDEKIKVEYIDSDGEEKGCNIPSEDETDPREEYIQPDMKEWIPVDGKEKMHPKATVRTMLVRLPTREERQTSGMNSTDDRDTGCHYIQNHMLARSTMLDHLGYPIKMYMGIESQPLDKWDLCNERAMIKVPIHDVKNLLKWKKTSAVKGRTKTKPCISSAKRQVNAQSDGQETSRIKSGQTVKRSQTTRISKAVINANLDYALLIAVTPWVGNVLLPLPFSKRKVCEADIARTRAADVPLTRTAVFLLFLKVIQIDAEGCKKVIEAQKNKPRPQPAKWYPSVRTRTVAMLLAQKEQGEKNCFKATQLPDPKQPPPTPQTSKLPIPTTPQQNKKPTSLAPQIYTNIHQGVLTPQPVGPAFLPLLQSDTQGTSHTLQPLLQLVVPVEPGKSVELAAPPTSSISSPSSVVAPTENAEKTRTSKRKCKPTMKAQALKENVKSKACRKRSAKNNQNGGDAPTVAVLPQTTAWILTSAGLMPIQLSSPGIVGNQNKVIPNSVPHFLLQPPVAVKQNQLVRAVGPSNPTTVTPADVASPTARPNLNQILPPSTVSNSPNVSSLSAVNNVPNISSAVTNKSVPLVPPYTTNVPTSVTASAVQVPPPEIQCNQNQNISNVVPQVPFQSPIILSPSNTVRPVSPFNSSPSPVANGARLTSYPVGTSQNFTSNATKVSLTPSVHNVVSVSTASTVTSAPVIPPVHPFPALNISSPVVQMTSPVILGNQKQRMSDCVSQVVVQQPIIVNQNGSLALIRAARPTNILPAPVANISKVLPRPAASSASSVNNVPGVRTARPASIAGSDISTVAASHAIPQANFVYGLTVPNQHSLRTPSVGICASTSVRLMTPSCQILPKTVVQQTGLQAKKQPLQTGTTTSNPSPRPGTLSFDFSLMFHEGSAQGKNWIQGNDGISLAQLEKKMPYLPPFVSSISKLVSLLKAKESFLQGAVQLLPEEERAKSEEEAKVAAIRKLVSERFKNNPAYSLLKARFLSCFTLPALLATIHPCKENRLPGSAMLSDDEEDNKDEVKLMQGGNEDQPAVVLLNTNTSEASATQFSGMSARKQSKSHTTA